MELRRSGEGRPEDAATLTQLSRLVGEDGTDPRQDLAAPTAGTLALDGLAEPLTPRERGVLALLAEGASNRAIAARLILSESTVKGYVYVILGKLDARSRTEAVARARALGLLGVGCAGYWAASHGRWCWPCATPSAAACTWA